MNAVEQLQKMSETKRREAAAKAYRYLADHEEGEKVICPTCGDKFPADTFSVINEHGTKVCARCVFVIALYATNGITKTLKDGTLAPEKLNSKFRKILEDEFYINPVEAYRKYLGDMIRKEEKHFRIVDVPAEDFRKVQSGDFPFFLMTEQDAKQYNIQAGENLTLRNAYNHDETLTRQIYAVQRIPGKAARKYAGNPKRKYVCFIPAEEGAA